MKLFFKLATFFCIISFLGYAQNCNNMNIQLQADIPSTCNEMIVTMMHDNQNRPYLYVAAKEAGLKIYDITNLAAPVLIKTIPTTAFDTLEVMNVAQNGNYVYLAIGNHFNSNQRSGMAVVDVTTPGNANVTDFFKHSYNGGSGIVKVDGNYAYLGAMGNGLMILDITNKSNITLVSQFVPDINYPTPNPNPNLYNARGMEIKNNIVYLCYDAGGIRIIDATNKQVPVEIGRYSNPIMNGLARAYNNLVLDDSLVYITVDYCGLEVLNISNLNNIVLRGWWNPYNCPSNNWFSSPVHANEIQYNKTCKEVFISTGKSDMYVIDMTNPAQPDSCNYYGGVGNNIGTWGVGLYQNQIYLSYICTFGIPFASNWTGVKILTYTQCPDGINEQNGNAMSVSPNPVNDRITITLNGDMENSDVLKIEIHNVLGQIFTLPVISLQQKMIVLNTSELPDGIYFLSTSQNSKNCTCKFVKIHF